MNKAGTIFEERNAHQDDTYEEIVVNPNGIGLEYDTFVSACEVDEQRIFWVISDVHQKRPRITGESSDYQTAEKAVLAALKNKRAIRRNPNYALEEYIEQRMERVAADNQLDGFSETARLEFVYEKYGIARYQVQRRSGDKLWIYSIPYTEKFKPSENVSVFTLNKRQLDNQGETSARGKIFCTEKKKLELDQMKKAPYYLKIFGLDWDANVRDVKYWFRKLSKEHHPDRGGNAQKFRELIECYDKAVRAIIERNRRDGFL